MYFFPPLVWRIIVHEYLLDFQRHHAVKFQPSLARLRLLPPKFRTMTFECSFPPRTRFRTITYGEFILSSIQQFQKKCSNYAHQWQPVWVLCEYTHADAYLP
jgi:hypothetical protein